MSAAYDSIAPDYDDLLPEPEDLSFYLQCAASATGPILELGTGTGRIACAMAARGHHVTGLDVSAEMLVRARAKQRALGIPEDRLAFRRADIREFSFAERFALVVAPFSVLLELRTRADRVAAFRCVRHHLARDGVFVFDCWFRGAGPLATWGKPRPADVVTFAGLTTLSRSGGTVAQLDTQRYRDDGQMDLTVFVDATDAKGRLVRSMHRWTRFYASPEEFSDELRSAELVTTELYGGFDREPLFAPGLEGRGRQVFIVKRQDATS